MTGLCCFTPPPPTAIYTLSLHDALPISQGPLEYAFGRQAFAVPTALQGHPLTVELYPGFARDRGVHAWRATLRVRFLLSEQRPLGDGRDITVLPGGRAPLPTQRTRELTLP